MRRFTVISGTPEDCLEITQELVDAGLNLPLLEVVGADAADNLETIRLMGEEVVPNLNRRLFEMSRLRLPCRHTGLDPVSSR